MGLDISFYFMLESSTEPLELLYAHESALNHKLQIK